MKAIQKVINLTVATAPVFALALLFLSCDRKEGGIQSGGKQQPTLKTDTRVTPESIRLAPGTESVGKDPFGRYWFREPGDARRWVYDPKDKSVQKATKAADGQWRTTDPTAVTAESLGLGPTAEATGKDPFGRYWFKIAGAENRVYDPKAKQLYRATKNADGKWAMEKIDLPKP